MLPEEQEKQPSVGPAMGLNLERPEPVVEQKAALTPAPFAVQGANRKGLVLLVHLPEAAFKALPELEFLQKLLKAIHHGPEDVAFVNALETDPVSLAALQAAVPNQNLISFGCSVLPDAPAAAFPASYQPTPVNQTTLLLADELATVVNSKEKKGQLWNALKQMFLP